MITTLVRSLVVTLTFGAATLLNATDNTLNNQLFAAISHEDLPTVRRLLKQGADANCTKSGVTPLMYAIDTEDIADIVEELLKYGANPNLQCYGYDETPLILAVQENDVDIVKLLLKYGANPNAQDRNEKTALYFAQYDPKVVELLKAHGATE